MSLVAALEDHVIILKTVLTPLHQCFTSDLLLLCHWGVVLLPPELPGGPEAGQQVPAREGRGLVGTGPEAQGQYAQLHHLPQVRN